jgi:hypothetical protein
MSELRLDEIRALWPAVAEAVGDHHGMLGAALAAARPVAVKRDRITVTFPADAAFVRKKAEAGRELIETALRGLTGRTYAMDFELLEPMPTDEIADLKQQLEWWRSEADRLKREVPTGKPDSNVPLTERDGYWLTPIEVLFYDALRETGAVFAVQPWVHGVDRRYRPDFMVFYDGRTVIVELDGQETHKTRQQRTYDAERQRWFEARGMRVFRWTGTEVTRNPQRCVAEMLNIVRSRQARY